MKPYTLCLTFVYSLLVACSTANNVNVIAGPDTLVPLNQHGEHRGRYHNLYPGKKSYPISCENDCYPAHINVLCETEGEQCQYQEKQPNPKLDTNYTVRWLGHAGFMISTPNGQQVVFDPVKAQFDSPVALGFKLAGGIYRQPGDWLTSDELTHLDAVIYSHLHYDHFNKADIEEIGRQPRYLTPLGMADNFPSDGFNISEMAWYASTKIDDLTIHALPAHHFSSRVLVPFIYEDNDKDLWNGWLLEQNGSTLFFAGDTGYSKHFSDIQQKYGDIDVCLMPIASYYSEDNPNWYRYVHTTPEDALTAAQELNCKIMIPWGYGNSTWKMGDRTSHSALLRLLHMHKKMDSKIPLYILNEGESIKL
ncbi:MAG TPA: Zn-dependent hydrolase [Pseudoalteromonas sp.]|jgi:L-ascorbate metabolism protein UlaG (beta-lactamase superfamily)|uniref:MBL fold metallo-hydrolase n=1 Tax=unclassified Pseudoalteromonas TaxID=194690 RepID=UPI000561DD4F|nr:MULTISPECIES: MBL fold metallo-hydrolase [unclassified Pseudoalteromonas]HCP96975.1 Zn-dependent hydrolase [Pseudoalteromonas sp.]|tara:strand:- start:1208 stop:2299 length:1092 start_codon:yes stop_codon:yes gene_type:complete